MAIIDAQGNLRYADKSWYLEAKPPSPELKRLYLEMQNNPKFHLSKENSFFPRGFPSTSPGWNLS